MIQFPNICPACQSTARHEVIPTSPEVETLRCDSCGHELHLPAFEIEGEVPPSFKLL